MAALFATYLPSLAGKSLSVDHRVLKHRAGKRCVFAYDIATADGTTVLVGKIYRKKRGKRTFGRMQHMLSAASLSGKKLQMAEPLAYLPEIDMLLLPMLSGKTLEQISEIETIGNAMQSLGQTLAVLHSLSLPNCEIRTMREHLAKYCHPGFDALCNAHPSLQKTVNEILQRLLDFDEIDQMLKPVHGDIPECLAAARKTDDSIASVAEMIDKGGGYLTGDTNHRNRSGQGGSRCHVKCRPQLS